MNKRYLILSLILAAVLFSTAVKCPIAFAQDDNPGLDTLNKAVDLMLVATTPDDQKKVISLCEQAQKEGLSGENLEFSNQILASTKLKLGMVVAQGLISTPPANLPAGWENLRKNTLEYLEDAVKIHTDQAEPFFLIAQLNYLPNGDRKRATEAMDLAIEKAKAQEDNLMVSRIMTAKAIHAENKEDRTKILEEALAISPDAFEILLTVGANYADNEDYDKAVEYLKKAIEIQPNASLALGILTSIYVRQERFDDAIKMLDILEQQMPGNPAPKIEKARILAQIKKYDEALEILNSMRSQDPNNPVVLLLRATIYITQNDYANAEKDIDAVLRINPGAEIPSLMKVQILSMQEKYKEAIELLEELRVKTEDNPDIVMELAIVYSMDKKPKKTLEILENLLKGESSFAEDQGKLFRAYRIMGDTLLSLGRHGNAVEAYEKAMKIDSENAVLVNNLAWVLATSPIDIVRDANRSLELATKACELSEYKEAFILSTLSAAYAEKGDYDKALEWIGKAIDMAKENIETADSPSAKKRAAEQLEHLQKEMETYKKREPWRELDVIEE